MSNGGDSEGTGISVEANTVLGPTEGSIVLTPMNALCGAGSPGAIVVGAHVEQHIEAWPQSLAGTSPLS